MATNMSNPGSAEEKLKWIFEMYDEDGSGMMVVVIKAGVPYWRKMYPFRCHWNVRDVGNTLDPP